MSDGGRGPGRPRDEDLSGRVVAATIEQIVDVGYGSVTIEAVARRAGVSRTAIYDRWPALPDLLFEATMAARSQVPSARTPDDLEVPDTGSLSGDLIALVEQGNAIFDALEEAGVLHGILADAIRHPHLADRLRTELLEPDEQRYRAIFDRATERGELAPAPAGTHDVVPQLLVGLAVHRRLLSRRPLDDELTATVVDLLVDGLRPR